MEKERINQRVATRENSYTPNKELSLFFIGLINEYFVNNPDETLYKEINHYLTSNSGIAALNILSGFEIVSAAAMFKVLRLIGNEQLNLKFISNPLVLGKAVEVKPD